MNFDDFKAHFIKDNRRLWIVLIASISISSITLGLNIWRERYFVFSGGEIFKERPLAEHICKKGFESIVSGEPHSFYVSKGIIDILNQEGAFLVNVKDILKLTSSEKNKCKLIIKDKLGIRTFMIGLISNDEFPFFYKINQIDELEIKGEVL